VFQFYINFEVLGLVQNMSHYVCPKCQHKAYLFGQDGAKDVAKEMHLELLGDIPLHIDIRETSDSGKPIVISQPDSPQTSAYKEIASRVLEKLPPNSDPFPVQEPAR